MQALVQQFSTPSRCFSSLQKQARSPKMVTAAASSSAADAGNNVLGEGIRTTYGVPRLACSPAPIELVLLFSAGCYDVSKLSCRRWVRCHNSLGLAEKQSCPTPSKGKMVMPKQLIILLCMSCAAYVPSVLFL